MYPRVEYDKSVARDKIHNRMTRRDFGSRLYLISPNRNGLSARCAAPLPSIRHISQGPLS